VLRLVSGDRVRTSTLDNEGRDRDMRWRAMPGNTLTGPFLIEGAMPGDTLIVHLTRVALNRDTARMYSGTLDQHAVEAGVQQVAAEGWGRSWRLDRDAGRGRLEKPGERLARLEVPLKPMIGSIGVAPPLNMALYAGDAWIYGGNLDYPRIGTGTTLHFPVFRAGAYLFLGDGHAAQGDGEISGQGLETSLDVEFQVELVKGNPIGQLWSEDAEAVMVHGIENSLDGAFQAATTGMAKWLKHHHELNDSEVAAVLGTSVRYEIAAVVNSRPHVVARLSKATLAMIQ
jgi:acetamidase/formamidase